MKPKIKDGMIVYPFSVSLNPFDGIMDDPDNHIQRYLSELKIIRKLLNPL